MMTLEYEQSLVETTVFLAVRNDEALDCEFHLAIDPLYEIPDEELRQREFAPIFRGFFTKLGLDRVIAGLLAERPLVGESVDQCIVREAARKKDESAELFVQSADNGDRPKHTMVIQVCPQSLIEPEPFVHRIRRELLHVADMLDERFGYQRETFSGPVSLQNLQRDRYRVLWDTYVEGRLRREGLGTDEEGERLNRAFARVMKNDPVDDGDSAFRRVFDAPTLTHRYLMEWAQDPRPLLESSLH